MRNLFVRIIKDNDGIKGICVKRTNKSFSGFSQPPTNAQTLFEGDMIIPIMGHNFLKAHSDEFKIACMLFLDSVGPAKNLTLASFTSVECL